MAKTDARVGQYTFTKDCLSVYPALLEPKAYTPAGGAPGRPKFQLTLVMAPDHPDFPGAKAAALAVAKEAFPGMASKDVYFPFQTGDKNNDKLARKGKSSRDWQTGKVLLPCTSYNRPGLSLFVKGVGVQELADEPAVAANIGAFAGGAQVLCQVNFKAYGEATWEQGDPEVQHPRVVCYVNKVMSLNAFPQGRLGGGVSAAETFKDYVGQYSDVDPTDDDIAF
jgi:hypothetical protein